MENYQRKSLFGFLQLCSILLYSVTRTDILGVRKAASHFNIMEYPCNCIFFIRLSFIFNPNLHLGHIYLFSLIIKQKYLHSCYFRPQRVKQEKLNKYNEAYYNISGACFAFIKPLHEDKFCSTTSTVYSFSDL